MQISRTPVTRLLISGVARLDPISVILEDIGAGRGKIILECFGQAWSAYWGAMGDRSVASFFCAQDECYLVDSLSSIPAKITDGDVIRESALRAIIAMRRVKKSDDISAGGNIVRFGRTIVSAAEARGLWDEVQATSFGCDGWTHPRLMQEVFGAEWWCRLPTKPNPEYVHLCAIVKTVQVALSTSDLTDPI